MGSEPVIKNCWNCGFKKVKQLTLFGVCTYFDAYNLPHKEIPQEIVDIGCKHWIHLIARKIIDTFDGKIIGDENEHYSRNRPR